MKRFGTDLASKHVFVDNREKSELKDIFVVLSHFFGELEICLLALASLLGREGIGELFGREAHGLDGLGVQLLTILK